MLKKLLENKKIVIAVSAIVIVIIVLAVLLSRCTADDSKEGNSNADNGTKQEDLYDGDGLEIIEDDGKSENRVDTSEYWEDAAEAEDADKKSNDKTTNKQTEADKTESGNTTENSTQGNETTEGEAGNSGTDAGMSSGDTPEDEDVSWGAIY